MGAPAPGSYTVSSRRLGERMLRRMERSTIYLLAKRGNGQIVPALISNTRPKSIVDAPLPTDPM
jgi:hypothetical protein